MLDLLSIVALLLALPLAVCVDILLLLFMLLIRGPLFGATGELVDALVLAVRRLVDLEEPRP
jgi:hypothetical protein